MMGREDAPNLRGSSREDVAMNKTKELSKTPLKGVMTGYASGMILAGVKKSRQGRPGC